MTPLTPRTRLGLSLASVLALAILATGAASPGDGARRHTRLTKSVPAKDTVLAASPPSIDLWFSEPVELGASRIRLTAGERAVALGPVTRDDDVKDAPLSAKVPAPLAPGEYMVSWSTASKDGHVVKGTFAFTVRP